MLLRAIENGIYSVLVRFLRETEPIIHVEIYFKKLGRVILEALKSKIYRVGHQAENQRIMACNSSLIVVWRHNSLIYGRPQSFFS